MTKITTGHLPRGTKITTSIHKLINGKVEHSYKQDAEKAILVVDHILVTPTMTGLNTLVVTTTPNSKPLYEGDEFVMFHISHVEQIISIGNGYVIKSSEEKRLKYLEKGMVSYYGYQVHQFLDLRMSVKNPELTFDLERATKDALSKGVLKMSKLSYGRDSFNYSSFTINKKKFKKWLKQNINRFIVPAKLAAKMQNKLQEELNESPDYN